MNTNYYPEFGGSTGGWLEAAETEEKYVMTWTNDKKKLIQKITYLKCQLVELQL